jgi:hypothetical protein
MHAGGAQRKSGVTFTCRSSEGRAFRTELYVVSNYQQMPIITDKAIAVHGFADDAKIRLKTQGIVFRFSCVCGWLGRLFA